MPTGASGTLSSTSTSRCSPSASTSPESTLAFVDGLLPAGPARRHLEGGWPPAGRSLALFSICGVAACVPTLVGHLWHRGFYHSVCADCYELAGTGAPALWAVLFCFSKLAELFDTALLVLKKRPLLLLHWFHHPSVIAFTCERDAARALVRVDELLGARGHVLILLRNLLRPPRAARRVKKVRELERHVPSRRPSPRAYSPRCGADPVSSVLPASLYADRAATWLRLKNFDATLEDCAVAIYAAGAPTR